MTAPWWGQYTIIDHTLLTGLPPTINVHSIDCVIIRKICPVRTRATENGSLVINIGTVYSLIFMMHSSFKSSILNTRCLVWAISILITLLIDWFLTLTLLNQQCNSASNLAIVFWRRKNCAVWAISSLITLYWLTGFLFQQYVMHTVQKNTYTVQ